MSALDHEPFPRGALIAAGALVGLSLIAAVVGRWEKTHVPQPDAVAAVHPVKSIDLNFADMADGSIKVTATDSGRLVASLAPGGDGFIRGVMRGLARDRISRHIGAAPPFRLMQSADGRLSLEDTATRRLIDLEAFGQGNRASFLQLLPAKASTT
jgi:putative photosynthetic complex assembly protein